MAAQPIKTLGLITSYLGNCLLSSKRSSAYFTVFFVSFTSLFYIHGQLISSNKNGFIFLVNYTGICSVCLLCPWSFLNRLEHIRTLYHDDFRRLVSVGLVKAKAGSASIRSRPLSSSKNDLQCPKLCRAIYFVCALGLGALFCCFLFCPLSTNHVLAD